MRAYREMRAMQHAAAEQAGAAAGPGGHCACCNRGEQPHGKRGAHLHLFHRIWPPLHLALHRALQGGRGMGGGSGIVNGPSGVQLHPPFQISSSCCTHCMHTHLRRVHHKANQAQRAGLVHGVGAEKHALHCTGGAGRRLCSAPPPSMHGAPGGPAAAAEAWLADAGPLSGTGLERQAWRGRGAAAGQGAAAAAAAAAEGLPIPCTSYAHDL